MTESFGSAAWDACAESILVVAVGAGGGSRLNDLGFDSDPILAGKLFFLAWRGIGVRLAGLGGMVAEGAFKGE